MHSPNAMPCLNGDASNPPRLAFAGAGAFGEVVAEVGAGFFGFGFELFHDFRVLRGDVGGFADVVDEVVKLRFLQGAIGIGGGEAVGAAGLAGEGSVGVRHLQFPAAIAGGHGFEVVHLIIKPVGGVGVFRAGLLGNDWPDVKAVELVLGQFRADALGDGGKQVNGHEHVPRIRPGGDVTGPTHDARFARAAFPIGALAFAQGLGRAGVIAVAKPRAIVRGEDHPGVFVEAVAMERVEDLSDRPVDFLDHVAVKAAFGFSAKLVAHAERHVRHIMRNVEKKRACLVLLDEFHGALGVPGGQVVQVVDGHFVAEFFVVVPDRQLGVFAPERRLCRRHVGDEIRVARPHVNGKRLAKIFVEAVTQRHETRRAAQMPFAEHGGGVAARFEHLRQRRFLVADAELCLRTQRAVNADAVGVTTGEERGA